MSIGSQGLFNRFGPNRNQSLGAVFEGKLNAAGRAADQGMQNAARCAGRAVSNAMGILVGLCALLVGALSISIIAGFIATELAGIGVGILVGLGVLVGVPVLVVALAIFARQFND